MTESALQSHIELTRAVMALLDSWGLRPPELVQVLSLPASTTVRALRRYRDGTPFPQDAAVTERIEHLVGIADALRTSFPHSPSMGRYWMNQPSRRLQQRKPRDVLVSEGLAGLVAVRALLDCAFDQAYHATL